MWAPDTLSGTAAAVAGSPSTVEAGTASAMSAAWPGRCGMMRAPSIGDVLKRAVDTEHHV